MAALGHVPYGRVTTSDPAAGVEHSYTFLEDCVLHSISTTLVTGSDAGADAIVHFVLKDKDGDEYYRCTAGGSQAESLTRQYVTKQGDVDNPAVNDGVFVLYLPAEGVPCFKGGTLTTSTTGIHSGDNFGVAELILERFGTD
jgi:hypothetical protein